MNTATKFQFDTDFDQQLQVEEAAERAEEAPPAPTFSEEDLAVAGAEGFARGRETGIEETLAGIENALAQTLAVIGEQLTAMSAVHTEAWATCQRHAVALSASITRKMVPELVRDAALETIQQRIADALPRLIEEPRVVIRVADEILDPLRDRIEKIAANAGFVGQCILLSEAEFDGPDCRIEWADGGAEFDSKRLWQEVDDAVERYFGGGPAQPAAEENSSDGESNSASAPHADQSPLNSCPQETTHG